MTIEELKTRKAALQAALENLKLQLQQIQANMMATDGAIQECDYWLNLETEKMPVLELPIKK